jgi:hypothetical protein
MKSASSHSEKQPDVKRKSTSTKSKTNWTRLETKHSDIKPTAEHPEASLRHIVRGIVRRGLEPLPTKSSISLRLVLTAASIIRNPASMNFLRSEQRKPDVILGF